MVELRKEVGEHERGHLAHEDVAKVVRGEQLGTDRLAHRVDDLRKGEHFEFVVSQADIALYWPFQLLFDFGEYLDGIGVSVYTAITWECCFAPYNLHHLFHERFGVRVGYHVKSHWNVTIDDDPFQR